MFFCYILRCADNTFYVGHTDDLNSRIALHNSGFGATTPPPDAPLSSRTPKHSRRESKLSCVSVRSKDGAVRRRPLSSPAIFRR